jgi:hypothetical protein
MYFSPNIIRLIKSRKMRLVGNVASLGSACIISVRKLKENRTLGKSRIYGTIIMKCILDKSQKNRMRFIRLGLDRDY